MTDIDHDKFGNTTESTANQLSQEDLGALVMVTLPSGATIQDILVGVGSGEPFTHRGIERRATAAYLNDMVRVFFANARLDDGFASNCGWDLEPDSPVWIEYPLTGQE